MSHEKEPQVGSAFLGKSVSRRSVVGWVGKLGVLAAASSACGVVAMGKNKAVPSATLPAELPTPFSVGPDFDTKSVLAFEGFDIHLNADALPVRWVDWKGIAHEFDLKTMRALKEKALASGEPEIIDLIPVNSEIKTSSTSTHFEKAHPILKELPGDVMTDEELEARGVKIVQADRTKLYIREGAFDEGQPLAGVRKDDPNRTLTIVLFDGEFVSPFYMQDERYLPFAYSMPRSGVDALYFRSEKIEESRKKLDEQRVDPGLFGDRRADSLLAEKSKLFHYTYVASNYELLEQAAYEFEIEKNKVDDDNDKKVARGSYATNIFTGNATIFLAAGTDDEQDKKYLRVYFDGSGQVVVDKFVKLGISKLLYFQRKDSFPDPELFMRDPSANCDNGKYPYGAQSIGNSLWHEGFHEKGFGQEGLLKNCEADVDNAAMDGIEEAWEKWEISGYEDNSGYPFVFSTPDGDGYILTATEDFLKSDTGF